MKRLKVSTNHRFLVFEDGEPFFWLGDTAWELFHRLNLEDARYYLENRKRKGFNVIQAVVLAEFDGLTVPNTNGDIPLIDNDPLKPNEAYFRHIDKIIAMAGSMGMFIALLPTWGDKVELLFHGKGPIIFNPDNAARYGEWIGRRYAETPNLIWVNGGDRSGGGLNNAVWEALGRAIKSMDSNHLMTFHPLGGGDGHSSSEWFHHSDWLDFNLAQSGHERKDLPNDRIVAFDYQRIPTKPCLDGEPRYEDHAVNWKPEQFGWFDDYDARQAAYWAVFSGAFGHTYGCHPVWQMYEEGRQPISFARRYWREALDLPGADHMGLLKSLILSRPFLTRIPDQTMIVSDPNADSVPIRATRDSQGRYAFVYFPVGGKTALDLRQLLGERLQAWWLDPRTGARISRALIVNGGSCEMAAPTEGHGQDWVLVVETESAMTTQ
jgi:hypothetical protein